MSLLDRILTWLLPPPPDIGPDEDVVFVDVRTRFEFADGHIEGARHIPYDEMPARWRELEADRERRVLVYCRTGSRSRAATEVLREKGFERVENAGGIGPLRRAGLRVVH